jgi:hypothetical protein
MSGSFSQDSFRMMAAGFCLLLPLVAVAAAAPDCQTILAGTFLVLESDPFRFHYLQINLLKNASSLVQPARLAQLYHVVDRLRSYPRPCQNLIPVGRGYGTFMVNQGDFGGCSNGETCVIGGYSVVSDGSSYPQDVQASVLCAIKALMSPEEGSCDSSSSSYDKRKLFGLFAIPAFFLLCYLCCCRDEREPPRLDLEAGDEPLLVPVVPHVEMTSTTGWPNEEQPEL